MPQIAHFSHMIAGDIEPTGRLEVHSPYDLSLITTVDTVGKQGVEQALNTAHRLFQNRDSWLPLSQRIQILSRAVQLMQERVEDLALEAAREGGKPHKR